MTARPRQAGNGTLRHWVGDLHEHDRQGVGGLPDLRKVGCAGEQDHVRHQPDQLRRIGLCERCAAGVPANVNTEI
jgi:hypothetical protein